MEPELENQRAFIGEHALEVHGFLERELEPVLGDPPGDAIDDEIGVPGTEQDADLSPGRQRAPISPHPRALALFIGGRAERMRQYVARIHPCVQNVDRLAFARAIHAADNDNDGERLVRQQLVLDLEQRFAQRGFRAFIGAVADAVADLCGFEHARFPLELVPSFFRLHAAG